MPREKEYFREVVAEISEKTGKTLLGVNDIKSYLNVGYNKAVGYLGGKKQISIFELARKLI